MFDKKLNEEKLGALTFIEYLKWIREHTEHLTFSKDVYWDAKEIIQNLIKRYKKEFNLTSDNYHNREIGELLRSAEVELGDFTKYAKTERQKAEVISIFKSDIEEVTRRLIYDIENA